MVYQLGIQVDILFVVTKDNMISSKKMNIIDDFPYGSGRVKWVHTEWLQQIIVTQAKHMAIRVNHV